jgi:hypothetical protein
MSEQVLRFHIGTTLAAKEQATIRPSQSNDSFVSLREVVQTATAGLSRITHRGAQTRRLHKTMRPEVAAIVEQSLKEHAEIWAELAKY